MKTLITGGRSGIGQALVNRRLGFGDEILTTASSQPTFEDMKTKFSRNDKLSFCQWDLNKPEENNTEICSFIDSGIESLILCAATPTRMLKRFHEITDAEIQDTFQTQMYGNLWLIRRCLPKMMEQKFGRIVFISSLAIHGTSRYSMYAMAKSGVEALLRVIATDYGEFNIRANMVRPGVIMTDRNKRFWMRSDYTNAMNEVLPNKSLGQPIHIAEATDPFLTESCYINGASLEVSGGFPNIRSEFFTKFTIKG